MSESTTPVPDEAIEAAARVFYVEWNHGPRHSREWCANAWDDMGGSEPSDERAELVVAMGAALAAVVPALLAAERERALLHARACVTQYVSTAEKWRYDRVVWAFAIMLGEIPEDSPCPRSPSDDAEAATIARTEPTA